MNLDIITLNVLGFSFNQTQTGTYGLVLAEENGLRRLMIVVGAPEAQSIAFELHRSVPPRPLTHDLFRSLTDEFNITLLEALIYKYENGVFFSRLTFEQYGRQASIESRTSDAVAIALRVGAPIRTTADIMRAHAVIIQDGETPFQPSVPKSQTDGGGDNLSQLQEKLRQAIENEDYEAASHLRDEIRRISQTDN